MGGNKEVIRSDEKRREVMRREGKGRKQRSDKE